MLKRNITAQPTHFSPLAGASLFSAQRLFSNTRILYACRDNVSNIGSDDKKLAKLSEKNAAYEKDLCTARSVMAKMNAILQEAKHSGKVQISTELARAIAKQLDEQRKHRLEDHQFEMDKTEKELKLLQREKRIKAKCSLGASPKILAIERKLLNRYKAGENIDTFSNDFLDRDTSPFSRP